MKTNAMKMGLLLAAAASMSFGSPAIITSGDVSLGVNDFGNLGVYTGVGRAGGVGVSYTPPSGSGATYSGIGDATYPGCICEGWGASATGSIGGSSDISEGGTQNLLLVSSSSTASTYTSVTTLGDLPALMISQAYAPSSNSALFEDLVTLTNTGASALADVRYTRAMDWDIPPTEFREYVSIGGVGATNLLYSSDNGFAVPNPLTPKSSIMAGTVNTNFSHFGVSDHGAVFDFGFGGLAAGESKTFKIFYGATPSEAGAFTALNDVGAEVYSLGQSSAGPGGSFADNPTFIFGFSGVGGTVVPPSIPEPSTLGLMGLGLAAAAFAARRRRVA
jgi:hypothetical protein